MTVIEGLAGRLAGGASGWARMGAGSPVSLLGSLGVKTFGRERERAQLSFFFSFFFFKPCRRFSFVVGFLGDPPLSSLLFSSKRTHAKDIFSAAFFFSLKIFDFEIE